MIRRSARRLGGRADVPEREKKEKGLGLRLRADAASGRVEAEGAG